MVRLLPIAKQDVGATPTHRLGWPRFQSRRPTFAELSDAYGALGGSGSEKYGALGKASHRRPFSIWNLCWYGSGKRKGPIR